MCYPNLWWKEIAITKEQLLERGKEIVDKAREKNVILRLIGGAAVAILAPKGSEMFTRKYKDIDFFGISSQSKKISEVLESVGMIGNKRFNALHGDRRLMFYDPKIDSTVDVFLDVFEMCHKITLKDRLAIMPYTIPSSDLLPDLELGDHDDEKTIDINYIAKLLADDWGFYTTVTDNIERLLNEFNPPFNIAEKLRILKEKIEKEPKSLKWKMRAKIGRKVKWYEEPEEVGQFKISGESL